jgi:hypothetical protein
MRDSPVSRDASYTPRVIILEYTHCQRGLRRQSGPHQRAYYTLCIILARTAERVHPHAKRSGQIFVRLSPDRNMRQSAPLSSVCQHSADGHEGPILALCAYSHLHAGQPQTEKREPAAGGVSQAEGLPVRVMASAISATSGHDVQISQHRR